MTVPLQNNPMATSGHQGSPHFDRQRLDEKVAMSTTKPLPFTNYPVVSQQIQPAMRLPEHFAPQTTPNTLVTTAPDLRDPCNSANLDSDTGCDDKSSVSSLQCGSIPPNPNYNPAHDPLLLPPQPFVPPAEISFQVKVAIQEPLEEEDQCQEQGDPTPPEWLKLPDFKHDSKNKNKSMLKIFGGKGRIPSDESPNLRRTSSLTPSANRNKKLPNLRRSLSEDSLSLPSYAIKPIATLLLNNPTYDEDSPDIQSPSYNSYGNPPLHRFALGKQGQHTCVDPDQKLELLEPRHDDGNILSPIDSNWDRHQPVDDAMGPSYSYSFSESYETSPTIYDSSSEQNVAVAQIGTEPGSMTLLQTSSGSPEQTASRQLRKGMVRREFQRRFFWFRKNNNTNQSMSGRVDGTSHNLSKRKDKTMKPLSTEWKQYPSSRMV